jgi:hypothetical protein
MNNGTRIMKVDRLFREMVISIQDDVDSKLGIRLSHRSITKLIALKQKKGYYIRAIPYGEIKKLVDMGFLKENKR